MEFIVDTATHRQAYEQRRLVFSWASFYAGVGVSLCMMLVVYRALPQQGTAGRSQAVPSVASRAIERAAREQPPVAITGALTASALVLAIEATSPNATNRGASVALEHLRWRGAAMANALDRDYAALAVMELMGKPRAQAEAMVEAWATAAARPSAEQAIGK